VCAATLLEKKVLSKTEKDSLTVYIGEPFLVPGRPLSTEGSTWNQKWFSYGDSRRTILERFFLNSVGGKKKRVTGHLYMLYKGLIKGLV
jgi:hypothetical protein